MEINMKTIAKLTDRTVLGADNGLSSKPPRLTARAIVKNARGEIAILYFKNNDLYSLPGGGIEGGESPIDALKREILEETGCTARQIRELGMVEENRACHDYVTISHFYVVDADENIQPPALTEDELKRGTELQWHRPEEIKNVIRSSNNDTEQRKYIQARDLAAIEEYFSQELKINCVWEHNGNDTLLYAVDYIGAYTRGENIEIAKAKMPCEIVSYLKWIGRDAIANAEIMIAQEKDSDLEIKDADSDVLFENEKVPLTIEEYNKLKALVLKSAKDFLALYESIPDKSATASPERKTFYGTVPRSADEMYEHTKSVNEYYFAEIEVNANNGGNIYECRKRGFDALESPPNFLQNPVIEGSYGEFWSLRKLMRRFIWHDRIHAKAMWRMAVKLFGKENVANPFYFEN